MKIIKPGLSVTCPSCLAGLSYKLSEVKQEALKVPDMGFGTWMPVIQLKQYYIQCMNCRAKVPVTDGPV